MKTSSQEYTDLLKQRYLPGRSLYLRYLIYPRILKRLKKGSVLDMGCGFGEFLKYLTSKSIPCSGIDSNEVHVSICNEMGLIAQVGDILNCEMPNRFENAILDNVLEHLNLIEIDTFLLNLRNILGPKGRLIAITPCLKGQARDPTHKTYVTEDLVLDFSSRHGMQLVEVVNIPTPFDFIGKYFYLQMRMFILDIRE